MLQDIVTKGSTDRSVTVKILDSTDGTPETGVVFNTSGIALWYRREGAALVAITEATLAALTTAHADGGFLHVSDGVYRLDLPDAAFSTGANYVDFGGTVTGMVVIGGRVRLVDYSLEDSVRMGLTALPNAAAEAAGGMYTRGTGAGQINQPANGMIDSNVVRNAGTAITASAGRQEVNVSHFGGTAGTFASGRPEVNTTHAAGTAWGSGAITAASIAADAFTAAKFAADVTTEFQAGLATAAALDIVDNFLDTEIADIQARLPAALVSGRIDATVGAMQANVMTAAAAAADLTTEIQSGLATAAALATVDGIVDALLVTSNKLDNTLENTSDGYIFSVNGLQNAPSGSGASPSAIADEVQTRTIAAVTIVNGLAANVITAAATAADFGTEVGTAVWATATRTLTAIDEDSTTLDLDATIRASLGMASANLDTQLADKTGYRLSATGVDDILDEVVEGAVTLRQSVRLANSALGGKASGLETTEASFRDLADTKDRLVATVDADGNRTAVTRDLT